VRQGSITRAGPRCAYGYQLVTRGRRDARVVAAAKAPLKALAGRPASYLSETDYFREDWQASFWGDHYARLTQVKDRYDPAGLFSVHHGVGTET
jgi:FAD/FMN-containing dehydrogenase